MKIKSIRAVRKVGLVYLINLILLATNLFLVLLGGKFMQWLMPINLVFIIVAALLTAMGFPKFLYDSDSEVLQITSENPFYKMIGIKKWFRHVEFPKRKMHSFKIKENFFRKRLFIYVRSKEGYLLKQTFAITFVKKKKIKYLKTSLSRVVKDNKENNESGSGTYRRKRSSRRK